MTNCRVKTDTNTRWLSNFKKNMSCSGSGANTQKDLETFLTNALHTQDAFPDELNVQEACRVALAKYENETNIAIN